MALTREGLLNGIARRSTHISQADIASVFGARRWVDAGRRERPEQVDAELRRARGVCGPAAGAVAR